MATIEKQDGVDGDVSSYSVPHEAKNVFYEGIFSNDSIIQDLPREVKETARRVQFTGTDLPSIPINWRFAESAAALKALEASVIGALLKKKYGVDAPTTEINTDHAQLFLMSTLLWTLDPSGPEPVSFGTPLASPKLATYIPNTDKHRVAASYHRAATTNIYRCADGRWFHLHASMNPDPTLEAIGLPYDLDAASVEDSWIPFKEKISKLNSVELQSLITDQYRQAGVICNSVDEYFASEHGKANEHVGLFEIYSVPGSRVSQLPCWWPETPQTSAKRPLAGLKVVDLTRVIAAPAVTRGLAELGASVMRVTSPNLTDYSNLHLDLNWGKWNTHLDLKEAEGRAKLKELVRDADVVVQGYRPGVLDKYGFGQDGIVELCKGRNRGIISVRENCYGWHGPWQARSGWQQISDACVGISVEYGKAMGLEEGEPVTPVFPNSDYMVGVAGVVGTLCALMRRADRGGSYKVDLALNYYNQWLARSVGTYPEAVWEELWKRNGRVVFRAEHNMGYTIPRVMGMLKQNSGKVIFNPAFFEDRKSGAIGIDVRTVKPIIRFQGGEVELGYNVGTRGNGVDQPRWPDDLMTEIVR